MFKKIHLDNNIPLLIESTRDVRSICIGIWVKVGSRNETRDKNGISHFLEHMFFKGTAAFSAEDIAMEIDSLGGELNAFTASEYTLFYVKVLNEYMEKAVGLLADIFLNSEFPEADMEKEKSIINEEINMVEDTPSDYVSDLFSKSIWGDDGLGLPILGSKKTIEAFTRDDLTEHIREYYGTENIVISCSGNFEEEKLIEYLNCTVGGLKRAGEKRRLPVPEFRSELNIVTRDLSEAHLCLGLKGLPYKSDERYAMHLLNTLLGAGYSSRLFQHVREKRGLVYTIYSYHLSYFDTGVWAVYAGTEKKHVSEVINITIDEMQKLPDTVTDGELERAKSQLKGNLILALESMSNKMTNIARQEIYYGRYFSPEEIIKTVESITLEDLRSLARRLVDCQFAMTVYGPVTEKELKGPCMLLR